jgi:hypothetical protein
MQQVAAGLFLLLPPMLLCIQYSCGGAWQLHAAIAAVLSVKAQGPPEGPPLGQGSNVPNVARRCMHPLLDSTTFLCHVLRCLLSLHARCGLFLHGCQHDLPPAI